MDEPAKRANARAIVDEHVAGEEFLRWANEEFLRLDREYPDGVPEDALVDAIAARMQRERPEVFASARRKPKGP